MKVICNKAGELKQCDGCNHKVNHSPVTVSSNILYPTCEAEGTCCTEDFSRKVYIVKCVPVVEEKE